MNSILFEQVEGCVFVMASHHIRIHEAKATDFYLRVRSRPIIEDSSGVRSYKARDFVPLYVSKMGPFQNPSETYHYFDLPFCKPAKAISLSTSTLWVTHGKTFETWICPLAHLLCGYCTNVILRLCQEIVFLKNEVAELLLQSIFVNLARWRDLDIDIQQLISLQMFWLSIDYLAVAKSAVLPQHIEILVSTVTHINEPDSLYGIILSNKYEDAWHAGNWNFSLLYMGDNSQCEQN